MEEKKQQRRWYDKDPVLKEALELLRLAPGDKKDAAAEFVIQLQEQVAEDVIDKIYDIMCEYHGKGQHYFRFPRRGQDHADQKAAGRRV